MYEESIKQSSDIHRYLGIEASLDNGVHKNFFLHPPQN